MILAKSKNRKYLNINDPDFEPEITVDGEPICQYCFTATGKDICDDCQEALDEIYGGKRK